MRRGARRRRGRVERERGGRREDLSAPADARTVIITVLASAGADRSSLLPPRSRSTRPRLLRAPRRIPLLLHYRRPGCATANGPSAHGPSITARASTGPTLSLLTLLAF